MSKKVATVIMAFCLIIGAGVIVYAAGSHRAASNPTVFAEECAVCHKPHNAQNLGKLNILSEENLCFSCHTAGGSSSFNIQQYFQGTANWTSSNGKKYNSHHDILPLDQTFSGAKIECVNCHNPHIADSQLPPVGNKVIANPDPNDGRTPVAGLTFPTSTFKTEFCLDCHDGSFPAAVRQPTVNLTNVYSYWTNTGTNGDGHGKRITSDARLYNNSPWTEGAVLQCSDCHVTGDSDDGGHSTNNIFQLKNHVCGPAGCNSPSDWLPGWNGSTTLLVLNINSSDSNINGRNFCLACHNRNMNKGSCMKCHYHGRGQGMF